MAIDFPSNRDQLVPPQPSGPIQNGDVYIYQGITYTAKILGTPPDDSVQWNAATSAGNDGYVLKVGDTMTGQLTLPGAGTGSQAATVDQVTAVDTASVAKTGGTMTGALNVPAGATGTEVPRVQEVVQKAGDTMTGNLTVPSLNNGPLAGMRNAAINADFRIWQRGTSFTSGGYTADRWLASGQGGSTRTVTQYDPIETTGMQIVFASGGNANSRTMLQQKIEDVRTFAGQEVTLSFEARSTNITQISTDMQQFFGSGGSPSATVAFAPTKHTGINDSWQKFSVTFTVPSVDSKTIGTTDALDSLQINFFLEAGSDFNARTDSLGTQSGNIILRNVQLECGPVATPFEQRPIATELVMCQRYYEASTADSFGYPVLESGNTKKYANYYFKVRKRVSPTCSVTGAGSANPYAVTRSDVDYLTAETATNGNNTVRFTGYTADAEL